MPGEWNDKIFNVTNTGFDALALEIFRFQYQHNSVYHQYADLLRKTPDTVTTVQQIPFLPVRFFKSHTIKVTAFEPQVIFESSGTTQTVNSQHLIKDVAMYKESFMRGFEMQYGQVKDWCILGLLPSYLERNNSSLVYMVNELIKESGYENSGFYLYQFDELSKLLQQLETAKQQTMLFGVTFALLDLAEKFPQALKHTVIMETGGMKGRRKEMVRDELHTILKNAFQTVQVHSEYGMTELLSQAYAKDDGIFNCPPWMKILLRDEEDPLLIKHGAEQRGVINVIDLANVYSCSFIATDDAGKLYSDGSFEVLGRTDGSDLRGCSLMIL